MPSELLSPVAIRALVELTLSHGNARTAADVQDGQREIPQEGACRCLIACIDPSNGCLTDSTQRVFPPESVLNCAELYRDPHVAANHESMDTDV